MHRLLKRQLKQAFGKDFDIQTLDEKVLALLASVEAQYQQHDEEKSFLDHTIQVNSEELTQAYTTIENHNKSLIVEVDEKETLLEQYKNAIDATMLVSKMDKEYILTYTNDQFCNLSQYTEEALLDKEHILLHAHNMENIQYQQMHNILEKRETWKGTIETQNREGESYSLVLTVFPLLNAQGELLEYMIIGNDISEIVQARELAIASMEAKTQFMANMSHEIRTPMNGIVGFTDLLMQSVLNAKQKQYTRLIQHSIQTLLHIINDILDFSKIESGNLELDMTEINPFIELRNVTSIFTTKAREKNISYQVTIDTQISECIKVDMLRVTQILSNLINNAIKFTPENGLVSIDISQVRRDQEREVILFSIKDTGIGIEKDRIKKIFLSFVQEDSSTTRNFGGTGLGLSISASLCKLMQSELLVESEKDKGSNFFFELEVENCGTTKNLANHIQNPPVYLLNDLKTQPIFDTVVKQLINFNIGFKIISLEEYKKTESNDHTVISFQHTYYPTLSALTANVILIDESSHAFTLAEKESSLYHIGFFKDFPSILYNAIMELNLLKVNKPLNPKNASELKHLHVLVAEDYDINRILIEELFTHYDMTLVFAHDGEEAVEKADQETFDMIFMDINMPKLNGVDATKIIRKTQPDIPIIALTANALEGDREYYISQGMSHYISKPIDPNILHDVLHMYSNETIEEDRCIAANSNPLSEDTPIDLDKVLSSLKDAKNKMHFSSAIMKRLFDSFIQSSSATILELEDIIEQNNIPLIQSKAHAIRGGAMSLHFEELAEICRALEYDTDIDYTALYKQLQGHINTLDEQKKLILEKIDLLKD